MGVNIVGGCAIFRFAAKGELKFLKDFVDIDKFWERVKVSANSGACAARVIARVYSGIIAGVIAGFYNCAGVIARVVAGIVTGPKGKTTTCNRKDQYCYQKQRQ